jgi:hypothetical protein
MVSASDFLGFSLSAVELEVHFFQAQGTSSRERWKKHLRQAAGENHFFKPLPLPRHQLWKKRKKGFSANKNHLFQGVAFPSNQLCRYIQKNDYQQAKITFSNPGPF